MQLDYEQLYALADERRAAFQAARPFCHVMIDNFFAPEHYAAISASFPPPKSDIWKKPENIHTKGKSVTRRGDLDVKELLYTEAARRVFFELNCGAFLKFLERLTGIGGLIGDPHFAEGGFHCSENGGYLDIHADFSHHDHLGLERRLNLLLYLNEGWREEYRGALSLFDEQLNPVHSFLPIANRVIVFATSATSFHGHPEPMRLPPETYRRSIALYYYSLPTGRARSRIIYPQDCAFAHSVTRA
jgi:hypothetical protein